MASPVMGPEAESSIGCEFSDKIPPRFNGHGDYASYREDVILWAKLTTLSSIKHGPAIVGHLQGEAKTAAKTISTDLICAEGRIELILQRLDKAYGVDKTNQLDVDLADFLDYSWKKELIVEHFISGFHTRVDKISQLNLDDKLKGHLLLRQADLAYHEKHFVVGAASGSYDVQHISSALRNIYRNANPIDATQLAGRHEDGDRNSYGNGQDGPHRRGGGRRRRRGRGRGGREGSDGNDNRSRPTFYLFKTARDNCTPRVIIDTGACSSVVGKETLDRAMRSLNLERVEDTNIRQKNHRFRNYDNDQPSRFAVKMPFAASDQSGRSTTEFDVAFDVIDGDLPFLLGLPSLMAMGAVINHKYLTLSLTLNGTYKRLKLVLDGDHLYLPFVSEYTSPRSDPKEDKKQDGARKYCAPRPERRRGGPCHERSYYTPSPAPNGKGNSSGYSNERESNTHRATKKFYRPSDECRTDVARRNAVDLVSCEEAPSVDAHNHMTEKSLSKNDIVKIHVQLRHGTATAIEKYIRAAGLWKDTMRSMIDDTVRECPCRVAFPPSPHVKVAARPPSTEPQAHISIDDVHLGGKNYIHSVDECTTWSEAGYIHRKSMEVQITVLRRIQFLRHGPPKTIRCDREYHNTQFMDFCAETETKLILVAANDHEANGLIENANRTLRSFYDRIRSCDRRSMGEEITAEAVFRKNISTGSKKASAFELLYGRRPRILPDMTDRLPAPASIDEHSQQVARNRLRKMLRTPTYRADAISVGDIVSIWRDASGWLSPARVTKVTPYYYEVVHNGRLKTSGINRTRLLKSGKDDAEGHVENVEHVQHVEADENFEASDEDQENDIVDGEDQCTSESPNLPSDVCPSTQSRKSSRRIPVSEVRRVLDDAASILQPSLGGTRSQTDILRADAAPIGATVLDPESNSLDDGNSASQLEKPVHHIGGDRGIPHDVYVETTSDSDDDETWEPHLVSLTADSADSNTSAKPTEQEREVAYQAELRKWEKRKAFKPVPSKSVPRDANIIGSHTIFKRKLNGTVKGRIVPWGHRDEDKDYLHGDAPSVSLEGFRSVPSIAAEKKWEIARMDIEAAYLQARGFNRLLFIRPPREEKTPGILWKLEAPAYGLVDSGRLWYLTSNSELIKGHGLRRSKLDYTIYFSVNDNSELDFLLAVQVDDYVYTGCESRLYAFEAFLSSTFDVGEFSRGSFSAMGAEISQSSDYFVTLSQDQSLQGLEPRTLIDAADKKGDDEATPEQAKLYRHVVGKMLYIGRLSAPVMLLHASMAASKLSDLRSHHLRSLASVVTRLKTQGSTLHFISPPHKKGSTLILDTISDGAAPASGETKGRGGYIIFRRFGDIVHPIQWSARRLRRVSRSSGAAETLAAADAMSTSLYIKHLLADVGCSSPAQLTVDSTSLLSLSTSIREPEERYIKIELAAIREAYDDGELESVNWCPGKKLLADALTKDNRATAELLLAALSTGRHVRPGEMAANLGRASS